MLGHDVVMQTVMTRMNDKAIELDDKMALAFVTQMQQLERVVMDAQNEFQNIQQQYIINKAELDKNIKLIVDEVKKNELKIKELERRSADTGGN